ncbi:serine/threonine-protein kinase [Actinoplanes sp. NPDC023801]|uniref:serine/threonine-protein kinase n=1 Tax=Actinoplanes sp. NPDC023801 TaxID=3154595 RepID=UPI0033E54FD2
MTTTGGPGMAGELGGRYRLLELIGTGGMGRVWRAEDTLLQRTVAIKELTTPASPVREARAAARLDHPGVVKVYDVLTTEERAWIVMEYVPSRSLHRVVTEDGPLPPAEVARLGLRMLAALRSAHAAGVLHRDVKPDNVLLTPDGRVVLTDFGLATIRGTDGPDPRLGSPSYIAPERLLAREAGVPGDLWSLGATLYFAVEGRSPYTRGDGAAALRALISEPPDPVMLSGPLSLLLLALLDKNPARRPAVADAEARLRTVLEPPPRPRSPVVRTRLAVAGSAVVLAVTSGAALAAADTSSRPAVLVQPSSRPPASPAPPAALMSYRADPCGLRAVSEPVVAATTDVPAGLPGGWVWFRDATGFTLALPAGWQRSISGNDVCFTDPSGRRAFTVNVAPIATRRPLDYWQGRERAELARGDLPGYRRISMGLLLLGRGGADWEYTWRPGSDSVRHERRVLVAVDDRRSYLLRWAVADTDWAANTGLQKQLVELFNSRR